ncbi:MAG: carboxymuconolactone decarboxylase family protein [Bacteroidia bacterium]|nr:carboxymuconolactone decarboxylase family protein [Bacteroidia bacterium]MDW8159513.1 carboxymuconolactone decarboxylase family protein [Bacteroidia bacterium]
MAHISLPDNLPGIVGLLAAYPHTGRALSSLAHSLLHSPETSDLEHWQREFIAAYVSYLNCCNFCYASHRAAAEAAKGVEFGFFRPFFEQNELSTSPDYISPLFEKLLKIAQSVQGACKAVDSKLIEEARSAGATDIMIHETILIAAAFCMYNRYVDGLATFSMPPDHPSYWEMGQQLVQKGYQR